MPASDEKFKTLLLNIKMILRVTPIFTIDTIQHEFRYKRNISSRVTTMQYNHIRVILDIPFSLQTITDRTNHD